MLNSCTLNTVLQPWDTPDIDHWAIPKVTQEDPLDAPLEESSFATLFPKVREMSPVVAHASRV
jgi:hypothetical protein